MAKQGQIHFSITGNNSDFLAKIRQNNQAIKDGANITEKASAQMRSAVMGIGAAIGIGFGIDQIRQFCGELINVRGQFQTFESVLTNTFGDKNKAKESMEMIQNFAATTPFQVDALTGSFVKLVNQGFTPTHKQMTLLGDLASSTGKGFDQLTEAIIDAQTGEFERLKEFGIRASKEGDNVTFTFKEQQTQVDFTASSIRDYILSLGELKGVQGSNAAIAATLTGQVSNLQDGITQMMNKIGQSSEGALSGAISSAAYLVEHYEEVGKVLASLIATYGTYKAAVLVATTVEKLRYQATLAQMAGMTKMQAIMDVLRAKTAALNKTMLANPYVLLATAVVAVGAALWTFSQKADKATDAMKRFNDEQERLRGEIDTLMSVVKSDTATMYQKVKAYDELTKKSKALTDAYSMEELASLKSADAQTLLNKERDANEYAEIVTQVDAARKSVEMYQDALSTPQMGGMGAGAASLANSIGLSRAQKDLEAAEELLDEYNSRVAKAQQIAKNGVRLEGIEENITILTKEVSTIDERTTAYEKLKELSPELASMYDQEAISLMSLAQAQEAASRAEQIATLRKEKMTNEGVISNMEGNALSGSYMGNPLQGVIDDIKLKNSSIDQQIADLLNKPLPTTTSGGGDGSPLAGTIKAYEEDNKRLKKLQEETTKNSEQFATYQRQIEDNNLKISQINGALRQEIADATLKVEEEAHEAEMALKRSQTTDKIALIKLETAEQLEAIEEQKQAFAEKYKGQEDTQEYKSGMAAFGSLSSTITAQGKDQEVQVNNEVAQEEQRQYEQRLKNFQTFAERYQALKDQHEENLEFIKQKGGSTADVDAEDQSYEDSLQSLNDEVLATIGDFESLGIEATDRVINDMIATLTKTKADLEGGTSGANNTTKIKAVNAELERLKKLKEDNDQPTKGRSLKEWQDMEKQLKDCVGSFNEIGDAVGGVAGEVISTAGSIAGSTISMVSSIAQLVDISINGTKAAAEGASKSIQAVESASVILAVISAVIQVATKIAALFAANKKAEEDNQKALREVTERNINAQSQYNALLREEATLLAEIGSIFGDDPYALAIANTERYSGAISELRTDLSKLNDIDIVTGSHTEKKWFLGTKKQIDDYSSIASVYEDLVDEYGNLNVERAQTIIDTQKMSDEDKERLEGLIKLQKEADEAIEGVNDYYRDIFGEMGSSLKDALVDAFRNGTDAGEAFCKNMVGMLEKLGEDFAYSMSIGQVMAEQQVKIDEINKDTTLTDKERADKLMALAIETGEKAAAQQDDFNAYLEAYQKGANKEGYKLWEADEGADRTATAKGIATASQDSVDENNAIGRTQLGYMSGIHDGVHNFIIPDLAKVRESFALMQGNLVDQLVELRGIRENTNCLPKMGEDISVMKAGVKNLVTKVENL